MCESVFIHKIQFNNVIFMPFHLLGLADSLVQGILATGYTAPTQIQSLAIPVAVSGRDVIGCAQTGTGKTAAFVLPILNKLASNPDAKRRFPRALIITPTRELALQIENSVQGYGRFMKMRSLTIYGGVGYENQMSALKRGVDVVIATPGRLCDHMNRKTINLSHIEVLVLDEADRMFDMGFINDVKKIIAETTNERQTLLFSATMSKEVRGLAAGILKNPKLIEVGITKSPAESITQYFYAVHQKSKLDLLTHIINSEDLDCVLVFSRTKHGADRITKYLERNDISSAAIHSERTQRQRENALDGFRRGKFKVLVATDIAARGIDVDGISHVINFDVPTHAEDYVHRIGRTGRANATGEAITFVDREENMHLQRIERYISKKVKPIKYAGFLEKPHESAFSESRFQENKLTGNRNDYPSRSSNSRGSDSRGTNSRGNDSRRSFDSSRSSDSRRSTGSPKNYESRMSSKTPFSPDSSKSFDSDNSSTFTKRTTRPRSVNDNYSSSTSTVRKDSNSADVYSSAQRLNTSSEESFPKKALTRKSFGDSSSDDSREFKKRRTKIDSTNESKKNNTFQWTKKSFGSKKKF